MSTIVIFSHPYFATPRAFRHMHDAIAGVRGVTIRHLEALYPDWRIDAAPEAAIAAVQR